MNREKRIIAVISLGYLGLPLAVEFAKNCLSIRYSPIDLEAASLKKVSQRLYLDFTQ